MSFNEIERIYVIEMVLRAEKTHSKSRRPSIAKYINNKKSIDRKYFKN